MRIAYLDCFSGISGDMFLGALIDAGVAPEIFEHAVESLNIGAKLKISHVNRSGITATKVDVVVNGKKDAPRSSGPPSAHEHSHTHEHAHHREHDHHPEAHEHQHGRGLVEIREIIRKAALSELAKTTAITIFEKLGAAEAKIHNIPLEKIHFHEVGAVDAIVDIICAAVGAESLGIDELVCSPLNVGGGTVNCAHGTFPVPAPATVELLAGAPVYSSGLQMKGLEPVRRDWCPLSRRTGRTMLDMILAEQPVASVLDYFRGVVRQMQRNEIPAEDYRLSKQLKAEYASHKVIHLQVAKKIKARHPDREPIPGERIQEQLCRFR